MALSEEQHVPASRLDPEDGAPKWQQINRLSNRCGYDAPNTKLRDELVVHLMWARLGEALDAARSEPDERVTGLVEALTALLALFDDYQVSDLSHSDAHNILVRYPVWGAARKALFTYQDKPDE